MSIQSEFESWASERGFNLTKSHDGTYIYNPAYYAFLGWTEARMEKITEDAEVVIDKTNSTVGLNLDDI